MFQFSQLSEALDGLVGEVNSAENTTEEIIQQLEGAGIDPSALSGLNADQLLEMLNSNGVDLSEFSPDQITEALQHLNVENFDMQELQENLNLPLLAETWFKR